MLPDVPVTVWEQIPVIVVFAFLLAGMAWLMVRAFSRAVADINAHYAAIIDSSNKQWQQYFDARSETNKMINDQLIEKLENLADVIDKLNTDFTKHDVMERQALEDINKRFTQPRKNRNL